MFPLMPRVSTMATVSPQQLNASSVFPAHVMLRNEQTLGCHCFAEWQEEEHHLPVWVLKQLPLGITRLRK